MATKTPPKTFNQALFDAMVRHQIYLLRLAPSIRNDIISLLNKSERDIADTIRRRLAASTGLNSPVEVRRLQTLLSVIKNTRLKSWEQVTDNWMEQMQALAVQEAGLFSKIVTETAPVHLDNVLPSARLLKSLVTQRPFEGRTLREWASSLADEDLRRISNQVRLGMVAGDTPAQIAQRVVGTARLEGVDGVTEITRRNAEAITRTAVNFYATAARSEFIDMNSDIVSQELYVATLDARTTPICRAYDGQTFDIGTGPQPPLHFNCRSLRVPVIDGAAMADRPAKPVTDRQLLREYADDQDLEDVPSSRDDLPYGHKGTFDDFAAQRTRELTGTVPAATSYQTWLSGQTAEFQDDVLGPTRGALFRRGDLTLDKFVNRNGDELTLHELAQKYATSFREAGLDPGDF